MTDAIRLTVDGVTDVFDVAPTDSLADALRAGASRLGAEPYLSIKIGCAAGDCGSCTVLMDGEAVCACLVPTAAAVGCEVKTVETKHPDFLLGRLQEAFVAHGAGQCGICTPGMISAARALLMRRPAPTRDQVEEAIGGVLCRCTGYIKIVDAVIAAVGTMPFHHVGDGGVGARMRSRDAAAAAKGELRYGADAIPKGALEVRVVRSPYARASFTFGDLATFQQAHGLAAIVTATDVPGENSFGIFPTTKDQPVFAEGDVRFRGEAVAAIVGRDVVRIDLDTFPIVWTALPALIGIDAATTENAPLIHAAYPDNILTRGNLKTGDVIEGHALGAQTVQGSFETSFVEHAYIEPEAGSAHGKAGQFIVAASTQAPAMDREDVARVLGVPLSDVRIMPTACGGGFGGKLDVSVQPILAVAAHKVQLPVSLVYSRPESMMATTKRHPARIAARASADAGGRLTAYEMTGDFNTGAYASWGPTVANRVPIHAHGPYRVPHVWNRTRAVLTNETPSGAFRGFGVPQAAIAHESLMDDLAERLGIDRWDIRRRNALGRGDATASGQVLTHSAGLRECLDALKHAWDKALSDVKAHNATNARHKRGVGIACMWYGCGNTALSNPSAIRITLERDGRIVIWSGAVDIGQGISTILVQIVRDALGIEGADIRVCDVVGDTMHTLDAGKTSASRQTYVSGNAARLAADSLGTQLRRLANVAADAPMTLIGTTLRIGTDGERQVSLDEVMPSETRRLEAIGRYDPKTTSLDANGQGIPYATYGFAAQVAEVMVDTALGTTKVLHIHAAHDVGRAINPMQVEGQIHGGIAQGLGLALMEEYISGRTDNLHDYLIPTAGDVPQITTHIIEDPDPVGPFGAKGVGEPALIATAPAILGAIRDATGVTMRKVPVLPHRLWEALETQRSSAS